MQLLTDRFKNSLSAGESQYLATQFERAGLLRWCDEPVQFRGGMRSHAYVGGREDLTENPRLLRYLGHLVARAVWHLLPSDAVRRDPCLIGVPVAGSALAAAAALAEGSGMIFRMMRQTKKGYGNHPKWVDGRPNPEAHAYVTIDNTITDGASKLETIERLKEDGYPVDDVRHLVLVDRGIGGIERLQRQGVKIEAMFTVLSIARAFESLGLWTPAQSYKVEQEIETHRLS